MRLCLALLGAYFATTCALAVIPEDRGQLKHGLSPDRAGFDDSPSAAKDHSYWIETESTRTQPLYRRSGGGGNGDKQKQGEGQHSQNKSQAQHTQKSKSQPQQTKSKSQARRMQRKVKTASVQTKLAEPAQNKVEAQALKKNENQNQQKVGVADTAPASGATNAFDVLSAALSSQRHPGGKATPAPSEKTSTKAPRPSPTRSPTKNTAEASPQSNTRQRTKATPKSTPTKHTPQPQPHASTRQTTKARRATPTLYDIPNSRPFYYNTNLNLNKYRPKKTDIHQMDYQGTLGADATSSAYKMGAYVGTSALVHSANQAARSRSLASQSSKGTSQPVPDKMVVRPSGTGQGSRSGGRRARQGRHGSTSEKRRRRRQLDDQPDVQPTRTQPVRRSERPRKGYGQARNKAQNKLALNRDAVAPQNSPINAFEVLSSALSSQRSHTQQHSAPAPKSKPKAKPQPTTKLDAHTGLPLPKSTKPIKFPKTPGYKWPKHSSFVGWGPTTPKTKPNPVSITRPDGKKHPLQFAPKYTSPVGHKGTKPLDSDWAGVTNPASRS